MPHLTGREVHIMIAVVQRTASAAVTIDGETVASQGRGLLVLLGVAKGDCESDAELLAGKIAKMRIFSDEAGKMNLSVTDVSGGICVVPNFTLLAAYAKGNRPDYLASAPPDEANRLFEYFKSELATTGIPVVSGVFGADMAVSLVNDGPVTICMDSEKLR